MRRRVWIGYIALLALIWLATCAEAHAASKLRFFEALAFAPIALGMALGSAAVVVARRARKMIARRAKKLELISTFGAQDADLTVFAPPSAPPESEILIQVMIHPPDRKSEAQARALTIESQAKELASIPLTLQLSRNDSIKISFECERAQISEAVQRTKWNGRSVSLYFMMRLPATTTPLTLNPKLRVFVNAVPAGYVVFKIHVDHNSSDLPLLIAKQRARSFKSAFLSYASEDRIEVLKAAQLIKALRMRCFQDVLSETPGDRWRENLFSEIQKSDVFLLFWSKYARQSDWVIKEAEFALQWSKLAPPNRPLELIPVLLEGPPPPPPPASLQEIHFNDPIRYVIFAEENISQPSYPRDTLAAKISNPKFIQKRLSQKPTTMSKALKRTITMTLPDEYPDDLPGGVVIRGIVVQILKALSALSFILALILIVHEYMGDILDVYGGH